MQFYTYILYLKNLIVCKVYFIPGEYSEMHKCFIYFLKYTRAMSHFV